MLQQPCSSASAEERWNGLEWTVMDARLASKTGQRRCEKRFFERRETDVSKEWRLCWEVVFFWGSARSGVLRGAKGIEGNSMQYMYTSEIH